MLFHILAPRDSVSAFFTREAAVSHYFLVTETSLFSSFYQQTKVLAAYMEEVAKIQ